jgi:E3 ubiquitin-protein ligase RNF5
MTDSLSSFSNPTEYRRSSNQAAHTVDYDSRFSCNICLESVMEPVLTLCGHLYCWPCLYRWLEPCSVQGSDRSSSTPFNHNESIVGPSLHDGETDSRRKTCPVCNSACSINTVIPIYVRGDDPWQKTKKLTTMNEREQSKDKDWMKTHFQEEAQQPDEDDFDTLFQPNTSSVTGGLRQRRWREGIPLRPSSSLVSPVSTPARPLPTPSQSSPMGGFAMTLQQALLGSSLPMSHSQLSLHTSDDDTQDPASEFLSRVLLMLGSFVVLCLLMF